MRTNIGQNMHFLDISFALYTIIDGFLLRLLQCIMGLTSHWEIGMLMLLK